MNIPLWKSEVLEELCPLTITANSVIPNRASSPVRNLLSPKPRRITLAFARTNCARYNQFAQEHAVEFLEAWIELFGIGGR